MHNQNPHQPARRPRGHAALRGLWWYPGWVLAAASAGLLARPLELALSPWGALLAGGLAGALQWALLGERLGGPLWVLVTALGTLAATALRSQVAGTGVGPAVGAAAGGALLGAAQGALLQRVLRTGLQGRAQTALQGPSAWVWPAWALLEAALGPPAAMIGLRTLTWLLPANDPWVAEGLAGACQGALVATVSGLLLALYLSLRGAPSDAVE
ncbi:MAG: hypothetical protein ACOX2L_11490 [Anaerolineae bacterium]|jgi:hypothetical protein|nr:hypothetical protein [Chloroflexota bacterium]